MSNDIEVSVVMPCLNEEEAIGVCIKKIQGVFAREGINGEIIVSDNGSTDRSREIAASLGARVLLEKTPGYGAAYLHGLRQSKGRYIVMGDSDNSYDFNEIPKFLRYLREGYDLVMGSRFKGELKKGSMSWSHRYIGNPILSFMTRLFFGTKLSDIHCGMRALTREAYAKMRLKTLGMEFATEMVVSALINNLKIQEVPINYYPRKGFSKLEPISDAWRHVRFMLQYCPFWLYFIPGSIGLATGLFVLIILSRGPFLFLGRYWDVHLMIFASVISILSYQVVNLGVFAHTFGIKQGFIKYDNITSFFQRHFNLEKGLLIGGLMFLIGFVILMLIFVEWFTNQFGELHRIRESILSATLLVIGLQTIFSSFFISLLLVEKE